jgi:ATP-binding protein involved in chromosome partitioning
MGLFGKKIDLEGEGHLAKLREAWKGIEPEGFGGDLDSLGWVSARGEKGKAVVEVTLPTLALAGKDALLKDIEERSKAAVGDLELEVEVKSNVLPAAGSGFDKNTIPGVTNIVLVASGKGGVGKSTVATNLAVALGSLGCKVGLLDADVYGPSMPTMFGFVDGTRPGTVPAADGSDKPKIAPLERHGIKLMSIGFLVDTSTPMVWRGPMIASAAMQLFQDVAWGELDYLVVDLPPGTGDIHLTISQQVVVAGDVIVSTPQDVALADVVRAKAMFDKVNIPHIGVVENMSYFICDGCDKRHEIFTHGGAKKAAERLKLAFLGEIPIETAVRAGGDEGTPVVIEHPDSASAKAFLELAESTATELAKLAQVQELSAAAAAPTISISGSPGAGGGKKKGGLPIVN